LPEHTFCMIKPDAVAARQVGEILSRIEAAGFRFAGVRLKRLTRAEAEMFYQVHHERPFFEDLCDFMASGPCVTMVLERENAILGLRVLMGATDPANAKEGTIRRDFGKSLVANVIHGSDGPDAARFEIGYLFPRIEPV
jgi:nucleoside-diphosphate kinase